MQPENIFPSVEALQARQRINHTSLGLVKPLRISSIFADPTNAEERAEF
jgi:hypothetical protein